MSADELTRLHARMDEQDRVAREHYLLLAQVAADVSVTKAQAVKTNGRVTALEAWKIRVDGIFSGVGRTFGWLPHVLTPTAAGVATAVLVKLVG